MQFQSKLHNNSILTGSVDSYCLVCDNYLRSEDEAFMHTDKPIHKKNLGAATRVEKFLEDRIIKVKKGYYCPFCNILLSTTPKVIIHIGDTNHRDNKAAQMLSRIGNIVIAFDEFAITLESWHGLIDNTCVVCNTEFDEYDIHRTDKNHILRLVQNKCEFGHKYVYRKVDEDSFFCLICGSIFSINEKLHHHENNNHKIFYEAGKHIKTTTKVAPQKPDSTNTSNGDSKIPVNDKHTETVETKKTEAKIDYESGKTKPETKSMLSPENIFTTLDGKVRLGISKATETVTLFNNMVLASTLAEINQKKPEYVNGAVAHGKSEKEKHANTEIEKQSDVLDRVDEFQKAGIDIDFTQERVRCLRCRVYLPLDSSAIQGHIEKQHKIEPKLELKKQVKKLDTNEVKSDMKKIDNVFEPKAVIKKVENGVEPKPGTKKSDNQMEPKPDTKKIANGIEPKPNTKKTDNKMEPEPNTKKTDNKMEPELNTNKTDNKMEPEANTNKTDNKMEPKPNTKKTDNKMKPEPNTKKTDNKMEPEPNTKKTDNKMEPEPNSNKTENGMVPKPNKKKTDKKMEPKLDTNKSKSRIEPKPDTKKQKMLHNNLLTNNRDTKKKLETFAKENNMVIRPNEAYCPLCKVVMSLSMVSMSTHANLSIHTDNTLSQNRVLSNCMKTIIQIETKITSDLVLNNKYMLRLHSFHCILTDDEGYRCMLCDSDFTKQLTEHLNEPDHKNELAACKIIRSLPEEFIREIRSDVYHCGYCNETCYGWTRMREHLTYSRHLYARRHAQWNLVRSQSTTRNVELMLVSSMDDIEYV